MTALMNRNPAFAAKVIAVFLGVMPGQLDDIRLAVEAADPAAVNRAAHKFKGGAAITGANACAALAQELEDMGRTAELSGAAACFARLLATSQDDAARLRLLGKP